MEVAASIAGFVALTDLLVVKYSKLVDTWKDAPTAIVRVHDSLATLKSVMARLEELNALSADELFRSGLNLDAFRKDLKTLHGFAVDLTGTAGDPTRWVKTKWTLGKGGEVDALGKRLDSHIGAFNLVLSLAAQ